MGDAPGPPRGQLTNIRSGTYNWFLMAFKPVRDNAIGSLIVTAAIVGWLLALALLFYLATQKA